MIRNILCDLIKIIPKFASLKLRTPNNDLYANERLYIEKYTCMTSTYMIEIVRGISQLFSAPIGNNIIISFHFQLSELFNLIKNGNYKKTREKRNFVDW
jgi:hypothetical protein